jgi:hypothetical protein
MGWESINIGSGQFAGSARITWGRRVRPPRGGPVYTADPVVMRLLDGNSTAVSANDTNAETTIANVSIPALALSSTGGVRLTASGTIANSGVAGGTVTFRVKLTDESATQTVLATSGIVCSTSTSLRRWVLESIVMGSQPTVQKAWGFLQVSQPSANTFAPVSAQVVGYSGASRDETDQISMTVTAQPSAASLNFTVTRQAAYLEGLA